VLVGRDDDADRVTGLAELGDGGEALAVELRADLRCAGVAGLEDAHELHMFGRVE
jgi:hypothetical protein